MESRTAFQERFRGRRILWQTRLGAYCLGVDEFAPVSMVATLDDGQDLDAIEAATGIRFCSRERVEGRRGRWPDSPDAYWLAPELQREIAAAMAAFPGEDWLAASPYPSHALTEYAASAGIPCRSINWETFAWFGSKGNLLAALAELGLPSLPGRWIGLRTTRYSDLASEFGSRFFAQQDLGAAGWGTAVVESEVQFSAAAGKFGDQHVWVTPDAGVLSYNVNAIATPEGTAVSYPSVQIVAQEVLNNPDSGHCGNDFTATAETSRSLVESIREQTGRIGDWIAARGYRGLFGLDFVVFDKTGAACAVDLNPRWQGSTSLEAQAARRQGRIPLAAVEIAWQFGLVDDREVLGMADEFFEPLEGSQVFLKNRTPGYWRARGGVETGVYSTAAEYLRPGLRLHELGSADELVAAGGIPRPGRAIGSASGLLRLCSLGPAVMPQSGKLHPWVADVARGFYERMALEPAE